MNQEKIKETLVKLKNNLFIIYPKEGGEEAAQKIANLINQTVGVAKFEDDQGNTRWGILIEGKTDDYSL